MQRNLILTGMPGAGKSTVGVILAKTLGMDFLDLDIQISRREGMPLQTILDTKGLRAFLAIEEREALAVDRRETVVATGGSVILSKAAMAHLGETGTCVFLDVPLPELERRLVNMKTRGIASEQGTTLEEIYALRTPLYRQYAQITVDCDGKSTEETVAAVMQALGAGGC